MVTDAPAVVERAGYLRSGDGSIYCSVFLPAATVRSAVVLLGPLAEEKKASLRPLVEMARALAAAGNAVIRVDFRGTGDASGRSEDMSVASAVEDALAAVRCVRTEYGATRVGVLGLRLGGAIAVLAAERCRRDGKESHHKIDAMVLIEPIVSGRTYVRSLSRQQAIRRMLTSGKGGKPSASDGVDGDLLDLDGLAFGRGFIDELANVDVTRVACGLRGLHHQVLPPTTLVLQVGARNEPSRELSVLAEALGDSARVEAVLARPFWLPSDGTDTAEVTARVVEFLGTGLDVPDAQ